MDFAEVLRELEATDLRSGVMLLANLDDRTGLSQAFFGRLLETYATDPAQTLNLAKHWKSLLRYGDEPALAYRAKGTADRLSGRWRASANAFLRAGDLATVARDSYGFAIGAVDGYAKAGLVDEAVALGDRLAMGLDGLQERVLAARARLNAGNALLAAERNREAQDRLAAALPVFESEAMSLEWAATLLGLSSTHLLGGDPIESRDFAHRGRAIAEVEEFDFLLALCDLNIAQAALLLGEPETALGSLLDARTRLEGADTDLARVQEFLGDAYLGLNMFREAGDAYTSALELSHVLPALNRGAARLGLGQSMVERTPLASSRHFDAASKLFRKLGNQVYESASLSAAAAALLTSNPKRSLKLANRAFDSAQGSPYRRAEALLTIAEAKFRLGESPKMEIGKAARLVRKHGFQHLAWRVEYGAARLSSKPLTKYRSMFRTMLAGRLATSSFAARFNFLSDKLDAIQAYLGLLLETPTPSRVREAVEVISQTNSVTLIDEILASGAMDISEKQREEFEKLRIELRRELSAESSPTESRRAMVVDQSSVSRRRWVEMSHVLGMLHSAMPPRTKADDCVIFTAVGDAIFVLVGDVAVRLTITVTQLEDSLRWLNFELMAPMLEERNDGAASTKALRRLGTELLSPWLHDVAGPLAICASSILCSVPWQAMFEACGLLGLPILCLHPLLASSNLKVRSERVCIWVDTPIDLPFAARELDVVLHAFPHATVCRTVGEAKQSMSKSWDVFHSIGHARHNPANPMFSALELSDGQIYAYEIARSPMHVGFAYLSACDTGAMSFVVRAEPDGLTRAFLAKGANAVLASLWPLNDESAEIFASELYKFSGNELDLAEKFADARNAVRHRLGHPLYWAPFTLFGGYTS